MRKWLVIDVPYMCHRAWHTMPDLSWKGKATGVVFQFLRSITALKDQFETDRIAFCFDSPRLFRNDLYPAYKQNRHGGKDWTPQQQRSYQNLKSQIEALRKDYLPQIGFVNVFQQEGYESDDLMAYLAWNCPDGDEMVLVTSDSDLWQCLTPNVTIYSPQKQRYLTAEWFEAAYGIRPERWAMVKAIAGCSTDNVKGIVGVGEATAIKYLTRKLPLKSKAYLKIVSPRGQDMIEKNLDLVQLPMESCWLPSLREDCIRTEGWRKVCARLGMKSITARPPVATRRQGML